MKRRYFGDEDLVGTETPPSADLGPLFSSTLEVHEATERGIQVAHEHADSRWKETAYAALLTVARTHERFTSDEVWEALKGATPVTHNPSALGGLFRIAAHKGLIVKTGEMVKTKLARRHRDLTLWRSMIVDGKAA